MQCRMSRSVGSIEVSAGLAVTREAPLISPKLPRYAHLLRGLLFPGATLLFLILGPAPVFAGDAECTNQDYQWAYSDGQSPCKVANALVGVCGGSPFQVLTGDEKMYGGPGVQDDCLCNLVEYNLLRVCAACQGRGTPAEDFSLWATHCSNQDTVNYSRVAPGGTAIPDWASKGDAHGVFNLDTLKSAASPPEESNQPQPQTETSKAQQEVPTTAADTITNLSSSDPPKQSVDPPPATSQSQGTTATDISSGEETPITNSQVKAVDNKDTVTTIPTKTSSPPPSTPSARKSASKPPAFSTSSFHHVSAISDTAAVSPISDDVSTISPATTAAALQTFPVSSNSDSTSSSLVSSQAETNSEIRESSATPTAKDANVSANEPIDDVEVILPEITTTTKPDKERFASAYSGTDTPYATGADDVEVIPPNSEYLGAILSTLNPGQPSQGATSLSPSSPPTTDSVNNLSQEYPQNDDAQISETSPDDRRSKKLKSGVIAGTIVGIFLAVMGVLWLGWRHRARKVEEDISDASLYAESLPTVTAKTPSFPVTPPPRQSFWKSLRDSFVPARPPRPSFRSLPSPPMSQYRSRTTGQAGVPSAGAIADLLNSPSEGRSHSNHVAR